MNLRFTLEAAAELDALLDHIRQHSPRGAKRVEHRLKDVIQHLRRFPGMGRQTDLAGVRRVIVTPYPYIVLCRLGTDEVMIVSVRHAARDDSQSGARD